MVRDNKVHLIQTAIQTGKKEGIGLPRSGALQRLVKDGVITDTNAREKSLDIAEYERYLKGAGGAPGMNRF